MNQKKVYEQVLTYHEFHSKIQLYFDKGINPTPREEELVYKIDPNWIKKWKEYSNFAQEITKKDTKINKLNKFKKINFEKTHELENFAKESSKTFFSKIFYNLEDFDCLINKTTYSQFKIYKNKKPFLTSIKKKLLQLKNKLEKKANEMRIIFFKEMFVIILKGESRIKLFSRYIKESNDELIQLTFVFPKYIFKEYNNSDLWGDILLKKDNENIDYINMFEKKYLKSEKTIQKLKDKLINELQIDKNTEKEFKIDKSNKTIKVTNNNLFQKNNIFEDNNLNHYICFLNHINTPRLIGLENIGATCYMNATLQCLVNIKEFTNYLLNQNNLKFILNNIAKCELLGSYCKLLEKLCCDANVKNYYAPRNFKNVLSLKNPLFEGIQANDSKDLIYFLLEHFNEEFNMINLKINPNLQKNENFIDDMNQMNQNVVFSNFINEYTSGNNNIIPKLFFSLIENVSLCYGCNSKKFNYQIVFSLEMPLEIIYNKIKGNQIINPNQKKKLNLIDCFSNYNEENYFTGEDAMYCNICQKQMNSAYYKRLYAVSPILIIILNRGKANQFDCEVDFDEQINLQPYLLDSSINASYRLFGVVTHFGTSDMGGHFIAYCRHRILNEWYCYNDAAVTRLTDQQNGYKNGVPYILFYESEQGNNNILFNNNSQNIQNNNLSFNPNQNVSNNAFMFNNMNNMNNINLQNNINMLANNMNNMNINGFNNNFQNNNNQSFNNNINNNLNMMPNNMNLNMNMNMNIINNMSNNINNINSNMNNMNNNMFFNNNFNNMNNNMNFNMINNMNNMPQSNNNINNIQQNNNINNIQMNNPNMNFINMQQSNNMNNN